MAAHTPLVPSAPCRGAPTPIRPPQTSWTKPLRGGLKRGRGQWWVVGSGGLWLLALGWVFGAKSLADHPIHFLRRGVRRGRLDRFVFAKEVFSWVF